ncbi:MAG: App1 family protein [Cyclobacteriaceae bacterium]
MSALKDFLLTTLNKAEYALDHSSFYVKRTFNLLDPLLIQTYLGFGNDHKVHVNGRLLEQKGIDQPDEGASTWQNMKTMVKRYDSDEISHARLMVNFQEQEKIVETNAEGFFEATFENFEKLPDGKFWHEAQVELIDKLKDPQTAVKATARVLVPPKGSFGVISDVDDTILVSHSADFIKKIQLTFLHNARTRVPFEGVASFYRALQEGHDKQQFNPVFYVSSSPWNLYDLLRHFCEVNEIPEGPFMLRDIGLTDQRLMRSSHEKHKLAQVKKIFDTYPEMKFILVGDSGQKDPEIYESLTEDYADHIMGIYIRDVTHDKRDREVHEIAERVKKKGIEMILTEDTLAAARHAVAQKWVHADCLEEVSAKAAQDKKNNT